MCFRVGVGEGLQGPESIALDNLVNYSVYIIIIVMYFVYHIHILPHYFPGTSHALHCNWAQDFRGLERFHWQWKTTIFVHITPCNYCFFVSFIHGVKEISENVNCLQSDSTFLYYSS